MNCCFSDSGWGTVQDGFYKVSDFSKEIYKRVKEFLCLCVASKGRTLGSFWNDCLQFCLVIPVFDCFVVIKH